MVIFIMGVLLNRDVNAALPNIPQQNVTLLGASIASIVLQFSLLMTQLIKNTKPQTVDA